MTPGGPHSQKENGNFLLNFPGVLVTIQSLTWNSRSQTGDQWIWSGPVTSFLWCAWYFKNWESLTFYSHKNLDFWVLLKTEKAWQPWPAFLCGRGSLWSLAPFQGLPFSFPLVPPSPIVFQPSGTRALPSPCISQVSHHLVGSFWPSLR